MQRVWNILSDVNVGLSTGRPRGPVEICGSHVWPREPRGWEPVEAGSECLKHIREIKLRWKI